MAGEKAFGEEIRRKQKIGGNGSMAAKSA